jgi:hypothetical protein
MLVAHFQLIKSEARQFFGRVQKASHMKLHRANFRGTMLWYNYYWTDPFNVFFPKFQIMKNRIFDRIFKLADLSK